MSSIISTPVEIPRAALDRLWKAVDPGQPHPALGLGGFWVPPEHRDRVDAAVSAGLEAQQLGTVTSPAPELVETLRLIATATEEYYAWIDNRKTSEAGTVLMSGKDGQAVLTVRDPDMMRIEPIPADKLAERFVDAFDAIEVADIPHLSVPKSAFDQLDQAPLEDEEDFGFAYEEDAKEPEPAVRLRELMQAKRSAIIQAYTAKRSGGPARKSVGPYAIVDIIDQGRVLTFVTENPEPMIQAVPGTRDNLVKAFTEAQSAL